VRRWAGKTEACSAIVYTELRAIITALKQRDEAVAIALDAAMQIQIVTHVQISRLRAALEGAP
jgi:hypothetical protein